MTKPAFRVVDPETYLRKGMFRHFSQDCRCSVSMTARVDVTDLAACSKRLGLKFSLSFLYVLARALNAREDYRLGWRHETGELICYDVIHPTHYVFFPETETCTPVYSEYTEDFEAFCAAAEEDARRAREAGVYALDAAGHPNWFDASCIPWVSYDAMNIELPDGYLYFSPIVNWGRYREENGRLMMPVTVRLNHAVADGFLVANVFRLLEKESAAFCAARQSGQAR